MAGWRCHGSYLLRLIAVHFTPPACSFNLYELAEASEVLANCLGTNQPTWDGLISSVCIRVPLPERRVYSACSAPLFVKVEP